ncbi:MAG: response regulator [bacterium]|nr:response regulator [bacterium]
MTKEQLLKKIKELQTRVNQLEADSETYRQLTEGLKDVVLKISTEGNIQYCSPVMKEFGGYEADAVAGHLIDKFFSRRIELSRALQQLKTAAADKTFAFFEFMFMPANKRPFPVEMTARALIKNNNTVSFQCVIRDVSERRGAEDEKNRLEEELIHFEKMEAIGRLAGGVAHDLNNVLSAVVGYPDLLLVQLPDDSLLRKPIVTIKRSGQKAAAIVEDLLTLARRGVRIRKVLTLNEIITNYLSSPEFENLKTIHPNVRIETSLEQGLSNIQGSPDQLVKVLGNLVSNAAESMASGGRITITTLNLYPHKASDDLGLEDYVVLTVSDNGIGINPEDREKIFEPFYSKKIIRKTGTGLGMAVVWGTVQDHDGYINFESRKGHGTTFELYFPVTTVEGTAPGEDRALVIEKYMGSGENILVVDDEEEQREVTTSLLEKLGYRVQTVASGAEALELYKNKKNDFALVILDMILGKGLDGLDTYKALRELRPSLRALIVSGFSETERVKEAQLLGAGSYIKKPCTMGQLGKAVKEALKV